MQKLTFRIGIIYYHEIEIQVFQLAESIQPQSRNLSLSYGLIRPVHVHLKMDKLDYLGSPS